VENVPIGQEDTPEAKKIIEAAILDGKTNKNMSFDFLLTKLCQFSFTNI
jgi:hypothetical protein